MPFYPSLRPDQKAWYMSKADASGNHHNRRILERGKPNIDPVL